METPDDDQPAAAPLVPLTEPGPAGSQDPVVLPETGTTCGRVAGTGSLTRPATRDPHHSYMRSSVIARLAGGAITIESLVVDVDGRAQHRYRVAGGPDDGLEFEYLTEVSDYLIRRQAVA